jgi:hypothetical protein
VSREIRFSVRWDDSSKSFLAKDEGGYVLGRSPDYGRALSIAIRDAEIARHAGAHIVVIAIDRHGGEKVEWRAKARRPPGSPGH